MIDGDTCRADKVVDPVIDRLIRAGAGFCQTGKGADNAIAGYFADGAIAGIRHVKVAMWVHHDSLRLAEARCRAPAIDVAGHAGAASECGNAPFWRYPAYCVADTGAPCGSIRHPNIAGTIHSQTPRVNETGVAAITIGAGCGGVAAITRKCGHETFRGDFTNRAVAVVGDINVSARIHGNSGRGFESCFGRSPVAIAGLATVAGMCGDHSLRCDFVNHVL